MGAISGIFLLKYIPEYNLRAAANTLTQDIRSAQMNALRRLRPWDVRFNTVSHTYQIIDSVDSVFDNGDDIISKTVDLKSYESSIRFGAGTGARIRFDEEGMGEGTVSIILTNIKGSVTNSTVLRTGAIRVTR